MDATVTFIINGQETTVITDPRRSLLDVLREDLHLTGAKYGCGEGRCGACSVIMDGQRVFSCITPVEQADGKTIRTIEGLADGDSLHPVQEAFLEEGAMQCGYCASGMILTATAFLERNPDPTDEEIVSEMDINLCRCNGYMKILKAVRRAAEKIRR
jgi:aerobic-type carbon monoxide dehydrogenase small subunit (CoxS/CutS family)